MGGWLALLLGLCVSLAHAQSPPAAEPDVPEKAGKDLRAFRITGTPPLIDGRLDDEVWSSAESIDDFVQNEPDSMAPPTERTVIQVAYDDRYLYVAARCYMSDPSLITAPLARRDTFPPSDLIRLAFDPRHDHLTAYVFHANPAGVQMDDMWVDDTRFSPDYDAVWDVATSITDEGWFAEFRIPFSQMRFTTVRGRPMVWGFNVRRDIYRTGEFDRWVPTPRGAQGVVSRMGHLHFEEPAAPPRRIEVLPYVTTRREDFTGVLADHEVAGGLDLRLGLGTSSTMAATFNPDFGQVEQDPAVLNLTVFETFFPEKRPFFLEDSRVFVPSFPQFPAFHSRRIGQRPGRLALQDGDRLVHRPEQTTILGATKLTGKAGGWTYGGISALTAAEYAVVDAPRAGPDGATLVRTERLIEPRTSYNVGRVQRDFAAGRSSVGAIGTAVLRDGDVNAYTGGVDYNVRWRQNRYRWDGHWLGTHAPVGGTRREGVGGATRFNYAAKHLFINGHLDHFSRHFRNADLGFLGSRPNKTNTALSLGGGQPDPWKGLRRVWGFFNLGQEANGDRLVLSRWVFAGGDAQLRNFWSFGGNGGRNFRALDDVDTRGGPPIVRPASTSGFFFFNSDSRRTWQVGGNVYTEHDTEGGATTIVRSYLNLQPSTALQVSLSSSYTDGETVAQWIVNRDVTGDGEVDHVYGRLRRDVLDVTGRVTYAFTRDLTLQMYLQPFVAVGAYSDIRRLARPSSFDFEPVTLDESRDFNRKSLRSNTVLRWEYRPGSTLFVVWNRSSEDPARPGQFTPFGDLRRAFAAAGNHVFMVKVNYWLVP